MRLQPSIFEVLVAFQAAPHSRSGLPALWVHAASVSEWLSANGYDVTGIRQNGGMFLKVEAKDEISAVEGAVEIIEQLASRVALGADNRLNPYPLAWVVGQSTPFPLRRRQRRIQVPALYREDQFYTPTKTGIVDAALELLAPLKSSSPSPAIAGAWATVEALLSGPGDTASGAGGRVVAGDRMAALVTCSYVRSELTRLSYAVPADGSNLSNDLIACGDHKLERTERLLREIEGGTAIAFPEAPDRVAMERVRLLADDPHQTLQDVRDHITSSFRRLYRMRNLIMHGGKTDAIALRPTLRTIAPLLGAGMDRIAHAWFVEHLPPLELAARASIRLETVARAGSTSLTGLLHP